MTTIRRQQMISDILIFLAQTVFVVVAGYGAYLSCVMVEEKKERQRRGLTDYYDNPIEKEKTDE